MRALCWHGHGDVRIDTVPDPEIKAPTDVIIKITSTAICGSDLHLYDGFMMGMEKGDVLGHEPMGEVVEVGSENKKLKSANAWWTLQGHRSSDLDAPFWLWTSIVDLVGAHERAYLDHFRRFLEKWDNVDCDIEVPALDFHGAWIEWLL